MEAIVMFFWAAGFLAVGAIWEMKRMGGIEG